MSPIVTRSFSPELRVYLDFLRGVSALIVLFAHMQEWFVNPYHYNELASEILTFVASLAVMTFFLLSGFLITTSILRNVERNEYFSLKRFVYDRLIRLYPPLLLALALVIVVVMFFNVFDIWGKEGFVMEGIGVTAKERVYFSPRNLLGCLLLINNIHLPLTNTLQMNAPLWSLSFEFWFYVIAMFAGMLLLTKRKLTALALLVPVVALIALSSNAVPFFLGLSIWALGAAAAILYHRGAEYSGSVWWGVACVSMVGAVASLLAFAAVFGDEAVAYARYAGAASIGGVLVLFTMTKTYNNWMKVRWLRILASSSSFSYTLYIIHYPLLALAFGVFFPMLHDKSPVVLTAFLALLAGVIIVTSYYVAQIVENKAFAERTWRFGFSFFSTGGKKVA